MKFEEPELMQTTVNTVVYSETQLTELSSGHGTGPFWGMFRPSCMSLDRTVIIDCHTTHNITYDKYNVCEQDTFPNHTCGLVFNIDYLDTECLN